MAGDSFFSELRKRKVLQAAAIYGAVAWGLTEVIVTIVQQLFLPGWVATLSVIVFIVGFPVAMFLAWTFDITSEGIQRTEIASRRGAASIVGSVVLLIAGTAGLFLLINPGKPPPPLSPHSVAVLPFENVSRREADYYLSEGLSDELRDQLGRMQGIRMAARSSSIAIRNQAVGAIQMAGALGVAYLVEGSVRRNGPRLSISVHLIDGSTGFSVWSTNYERSRLELLEVQQDVARQVVGIVLPDTPAMRVAAPVTLDPTANDLLLLARHKENEVRSRPVVDTDTLLEAIQLYRQATQIDPGSAIARSRLGSALLYLGDIEAAEEPIMMALEIDAELSEVQNTLGVFHWARGEPEFREAFEKAVELDEDNVDALHNLANARWMTMANKEDGDGAEELFRRAVTLDPLSLSRHAALGEYLGQAAKWDKLPPVINTIRERFDDGEAHRVIGLLHEFLGEVDLAIAWTLKARQLEPDNPDHVDKLADLFALIGDAETALRLAPSPTMNLMSHFRRYDAVIEIGEDRIFEEPGDVEARYLLAFAYGATGAYDQAIHVLSSTGLPDTVLNDQARSLLEFDGFHILMDALAGSGIPEAVESAKALAEWNENTYWYGDPRVIGIYRACTRAIIGRHDEALEVLQLMKESPRLYPLSMLHDCWCLQQYKDEPVYQDALNERLERRAALREKLPDTLAEFGLSQVDHIEILRNIAAYHHEAVNGTGYPDGYGGEEIPLEARIVARVLKFNFGPKEGVPPVTILYPIDFLPAS